MNVRVALIYYSFMFASQFLMAGNLSYRPLASGSNIKTGAERLELYLPFIKDKKVGLVVNHSSLIKRTHLLDTLLTYDVEVTMIFSPEHGFTGTASAYESIRDERDLESGILIRSLYGKNKKPMASDLEDLEVVLFDIQDVGARFYTYLSTMHYVMEACAENNVPFIVLDRPNPNGNYVDGPILETKYTSFIGMHSIPIVHGMTLGELAQMINGQKWLKNGIQCELRIISCQNWDHGTEYILPISPSPNLKDQLSVYLYPSLCLFESTVISIGRGTIEPFRVIGHPLLKGSYSFIPRSRQGASNPKFENEVCFGEKIDSDKIKRGFTIQYLIRYYQMFEGREFFSKYFDYLAGTSTLREQIVAGYTETQIRASWYEDLREFKQKRKKYLLYKDFE